MICCDFKFGRDSGEGVLSPQSRFAECGGVGGVRDGGGAGVAVGILGMEKLLCAGSTSLRGDI